MPFSISQRRTITLEANADFSTRQYHIVELTTTPGQCKLAAANTGYGVLQNHPLSGEACTVVIDGPTRCRAGGAISLGDLVTAANTGYATAVGSAGTNGKIMGRALTAAASGSIFTMDIDKFSVTSGGVL